MREALALPIFGVIFVVVGILFLRREKRLYENSIMTTAKLYNY